MKRRSAIEVPNPLLPRSVGRHAFVTVADDAEGPQSVGRAGGGPPGESSPGRFVSAIDRSGSPSATWSGRDEGGYCATEMRPL